MQNSTQPILLFDCDPGCDDALAIALVARRQLVEAPPYREVHILSVAGNVSVKQTTFNAARVLTACLLDQAANENEKRGNSKDPLAKCFKVFEGCPHNMDGDEPSAASVHGRDGLGDAPNCLIWEKKESRSGQNEAREKQARVLMSGLVVNKASAVEKYLTVARKKTKPPFDLLCTGPLTNLATALNTMSKAEQVMFWGKCRNAVIMAGAFGLGGNITHSAEFNTFSDPTAVKIVLDSFEGFLTAQNGADKIKKRLHFVSLDVTETVAILLDSKKDKDPISHLATFLRYALKQYGQFHAFHCKRPVVRDGRGNILELDRFNSEAYANAQLAGSNGDGELKRFCYLHDPLAAWILLRNLFDSEIWKEDEIRIETGLGQGRGRVILCEPRAKRGTTPVPIASHGLTVKWLDPNSRTFEKRLRRQFIDEIAGLLEIRRSWSRKGNNTASNAK